MKYRIALIAKAVKDLDDLEAHNFGPIKKKIIALADNPRPFGCKKLSSDEGYRIRFGDFRIVYRINDPAKEVIVYRVKRRSEAYR